MFGWFVQFKNVLSCETNEKEVSSYMQIHVYIVHNTG